MRDPNQIILPLVRVAKCRRCDDCGQIANTADGEPWSYWEALPGQSALAVDAGLVKPIPCPACRPAEAKPKGRKAR